MRATAVGRYAVVANGQAHLGRRGRGDLTRAAIAILLRQRGLCAVATKANGVTRGSNGGLERVCGGSGRSPFLLRLLDRAICSRATQTFLARRRAACTALSRYGSIRVIRMRTVQEVRRGPATAGLLRGSLLTG